MAPMAVCAGCTSPSKVYCKECEKQWCDSCSSCIHSLPLHKTHTLLSIDEAKAFMEDAKDSLCATHFDEKLKLYCLDDQELVCLMCNMFGSHKNHKVELVDDMADRSRRELRDLIGEVEMITKQLSSKKNDLAAKTTKLHESAKQKKREIRQLFDKLKTLLDKRMLIILADIEKSEMENAQQFAQQMQELENSFTVALKLAKEATEIVNAKSNTKVLRKVRSTQDELNACRASGQTLRDVEVLGEEEIVLDINELEVTNAIQKLVQLVRLMPTEFVTMFGQEKVSPGSVLIQWKSATGSTGFQLEVQEHEPDEKEVDAFRKVYEGNSTEFLLTNLKPKRVYGLRVRSFMNQTTFSAWSCMSFQTKDVPLLKLISSSGAVSICSDSEWTTCTSTSNSLVVSEVSLSSMGNCSWRIQIPQVQNYIAFGVSSSPTPSNWANHSQDGLTMLYFQTNNSLVYTNGACITPDAYRAFNICSGDEIKVDIDRASKAIILSNVSLGGSCSFALPAYGAIHPAVFLYGATSVKVSCEIMLDNVQPLSTMVHQGKFLLCAYCKGSPHCGGYSVGGDGNNWYCHKGCHRGAYCSTQDGVFAGINWICGTCRGVQKWTCCSSTDKNSVNCCV
eukprot:TRINITY_DN2317_c0_g1_i2.p1 TRINITY_DN2317_c0_g1~~TRINITY_DN2317_c0_g1_i2.p1  ORF type:complete len:620 (-),score=147.56 TRINITY_DN2317_c0_g1_i2:1618-3477(-)